MRIKKSTPGCALSILIMGCLGSILLIGWAWVWLFARPQPGAKTSQLFQGVNYAREVRQSPRPLVIHIITVQLSQEGLSFLVTPGDAKKDLPLRARTTTQFLREFGLQVAINGDGFTPWRSNSLLDYYPHGGDPVQPFGLAASKGTIYARGDGRQPVLYISRANQARFNAPIGKVYNAISGNAMILEQGQVLSGLEQNLAPRSALGLDKPAKRLYLVVVDGRQSNYSEGVSLKELGQILLRVGAFNAMNLDGGGSSTLVMQNRLGLPEVLNAPIDNQIPGRERPVGNHLGIYAPRLK